MNRNILISYYSRTGNTRAIAQMIQAKIGGDMFEVDTVEPYPADYHETTEVADEQIKNEILPAIKEITNLDKYDTIFIGTPAWWGKMAPALNTFIKNSDFTGKTIVPFITHGGGGAYSIGKDMEDLTGVKTLKPFSVYGVYEEWLSNPKRADYSDKVKKDLENWLNGLDL